MNLRTVSIGLEFPLRNVLTLLHLADQLLVEQTTGLLVERAVDGDEITLC